MIRIDFCATQQVLSYATNTSSLLLKVIGPPTVIASEPLALPERFGHVRKLVTSPGSGRSGWADRIGIKLYLFVRSAPAVLGQRTSSGRSPARPSRVVPECRSPSKGMGDHRRASDATGRVGLATAKAVRRRGGAGRAGGAHARAGLDALKAVVRAVSATGRRIRWKAAPGAAPQGPAVAPTPR